MSNSLIKAAQDKYAELQRMTDYNRISYFSSFHRDREAFLEPQFNKNGAFTEKLLSHNAFLMGAKIFLITGASAVFGFALGFIMSGFEFQSTRVINTDRTSRSQLKQHFFGYSRFLKKQSLHFARFGLFISLLEIPLEIVNGRVNAPVIFFSGGMAAVLQQRYKGFGNAFSAFLGSGLFIGCLGLFMNKGKDKS